MKTNLFFLIAFLLAFAGLEQVQGQSFAQDTVWDIDTDQSAGLFQVKFSDNDSIIWAMGLENGLFFDAKTGQEINRIPGNHEVFFINNDKNFIRTNVSRTKIEIFDTKTFQVVDTLENDDLVLTGSYDISKNKKYFIATIPDGFRIWNLQTKSILKTKIYPKEPNLVGVSTDVVFFTCDNNNFIGHLVKTYEDPSNPGNPNYYKVFGSYIVYDFNTLDSIDNFINSRGSRVSEHCQYIAVATGDPNYGVEVYDFNTKELIWKLPINGPSLSGIEFSPDDKFLVTSNGQGANSLIIWSMETGKVIYEYANGTYYSIDISHKSNYILCSSGNYLFLYKARFSGTPVQENPNSQTILYPNPTNGMVTISFSNPIPERTKITVHNLDGLLIRELYNNFLETGQQNISANVSDLSNGVYFIKVDNSKLSLFFKLIINK